MPVCIYEHPFDPWREVQAHQQRLRAGGFGALAFFVGTMRDFNEGSRVEAMHLEHYPGMTEACIARAVREACAAFDVEDVFVAHRVGRVVPGEPIVAVAVWAKHRRDACAVNRQLVEELKSGAPFWKKETLADGHRWVERNTPPPPDYRPPDGDDGDAHPPVAMRSDDIE